MVEATRGLPDCLRVATAAVRAKLISVGIAMTGRTLSPQSQERLIQVLQLDFRSSRGQDVGGIVAGRAGQLAVLAFQCKPGGAGMIKFLAIDLGEGELPAVVFEVAACAIHLRLRRVVRQGVVAGMHHDLTVDLRVAIQALESTVGEPEVVARGAFRGSLESLVGTRERTGGDLCMRSPTEQNKRCQSPPQTCNWSCCQAI